MLHLDEREHRQWRGEHDHQEAWQEEARATREGSQLLVRDPEDSGGGDHVEPERHEHAPPPERVEQGQERRPQNR